MPGHYSSRMAFPGSRWAGWLRITTPFSGNDIRRYLMNWDTMKGNWKQVKGSVKEQWGKLTDDHLDVIDGRREKLVGRIQESYGVARDEAERQVSDWEKRNEHAFDQRAKV